MSGAAALDTRPVTDRPDVFAIKGGGNAALFVWGQTMSDMSSPKPLPIGRGLAGRCPGCGEGHMFNGFLTLRPACEKCGLDYSFADAGDGPAVFAILFGGAIVVIAALFTEIVYQPPYWLHAVLWLPLILLVTLLPLRMIKGLLIALQYHHKAAPGRLIYKDESREGRP
jgi:uncharacterized protein (DUF983 family)